MMKVYLFFILLISYGTLVGQDKHFKGRMFNDLEVTTQRHVEKSDTVYTFHITEEGNDLQRERSKRYYWFYLNEIRSTVGDFSGKLLHGAYEKFDRSGRLLEKGNFSDGLKTGNWTRWYPNGSTASSYSWVYGVRSGSFEEFYSNGHLSKSGYYRKGQPVGRISYYDVAGEVIKEDRYRNGKIVVPRVPKKKVDRDTTSQLKRRPLFNRKFNKDSTGQVSNPVALPREQNINQSPKSNNPRVKITPMPETNKDDQKKKATRLKKTKQY